MGLKAFFLSTTALTVLAAPVAAQADEMDWAGFYAGLGITGLAGGTLDTGELLESATPVTLEGFAGFNTVMNQLLLGGEINVSAANFQVVGDPDYHFQGIADVKGKIGYAGDGWSAYALGGVSGGAFDYNGLDIMYYGYNVGAGGAVMVTDNLFVGLEFVHRGLPHEAAAKKVAKKKAGSMSTSVRTISGKIGFVFN